MRAPFGTNDRWAVSKLLIALVILFSVFNHVCRKAVNEEGGQILTGYEAFRSDMGTKLYNLSFYCPSTIQDSCGLVMNSIVLILGLHE